ncbi:MAG TPA: DUF3108 domain-containing protein [Methylophilaceae bacterium]|nr:DUF3108 domain-containing protein [Methylophilaceae bacterium]
MSSKKPWNLADFQLFAIALLLSLLLHLLMLGGLNLRLPALEVSKKSIDVQLAQRIQPQPEQQAATPQPEPKPVKKARPKLAPEPLPEKTAPESSPESSTEPPAEAAAPVENPAEAAADPANPEPVAEQLPVQEQVENEASSILLESAAYIEMDYDLRRNADGATIGVAHISYKHDRDGTYQLSNTMEAKGLMSFFLPGKLVQTSSGKVTEKGLQPAQYDYKFGNNADRSQSANFDWQAGTLTMQTSKRTTTVPLLEGTQDLLSFMFQFMYAPPLEQMQLPITNGKKLRSYSYSFEGEEELKTRLGNLQTVHIGRSTGDGDEKTELWLAVDYRYLPVKIRQTDKDGGVIEQIVTSLSTDILK